MKNTERQNEQQNISDIETNAIYKITDAPDTPPEVKKYLLDYLFEKTGISVEFLEVETGESISEIKPSPAQVIKLSEWENQQNEVKK